MNVSYPQSLVAGRQVRYISPSGLPKTNTFASREDALAEALALAERGIPVWDWEDEEWVNPPSKA